MRRRREKRQSGFLALSILLLCSLYANANIRRQEQVTREGRLAGDLCSRAEFPASPNDDMISQMTTWNDFTQTQGHAQLGCPFSAHLFTTGAGRQASTSTFRHGAGACLQSLHPGAFRLSDFPLSFPLSYFLLFYVSQLACLKTSSARIRES